MVLMFPGSLWTTSITWSSCGKNLPWKWEERDLEPGECEPPDLCPWPSLQLLHMAVLYNYIQQNLKKSLVQSSTLLLSQLLFSHNAFPWKKGWVWKKNPTISSQVFGISGHRTAAVYQNLPPQLKAFWPDVASNVFLCVWHQFPDHLKGPEVRLNEACSFERPLPELQRWSRRRSSVKLTEEWGVGEEGSRGEQRR